MHHPSKAGKNLVPPDPTRRLLLAGLLTAYTASLIPWALAQPVADTDQGTFLALSAILAGRQALDGAQAKRLYEALKADDPGFPAAAQALLTLINERKTDPMQLQKLLDSREIAAGAVAAHHRHRLVHGHRRQQGTRALPGV